MLLRGALLFVILLCGPTGLFAETRIYEKALVTRMHMVNCQEPPHGGFLSSLISSTGPVSGSFECPEYELEAAQVRYRIRPRRDVLIPVGQEVRYRFQKRDLFLLTEDADKEIACGVVEMKLRRSSSNSVDADGDVLEHHRACLTMNGDTVPCGSR